MARLAVRSMLLASIVSMFAATGATGQGGRPNPELLRQTHPQDWELRTRLSVRAYFDRFNDPEQQPQIDTWNIATAAIVYPIPGESASHRTHTRRITSRLQFNGHDVFSGMPREVGPFPGATRYGLWEFAAPGGQPVAVREMILNLEVPVTSYRTELDEAIADTIDWPKDGFPDDLKSLFSPLPYLDYDPTVGVDTPYDKRDIKRLLTRWTGGQDPKRLRPWMLTKFLAGKVAESYRPSGNGLTFSHTTQMEGVEVKGATLAARNLSGTPFDMALLTVAILREAGLPARLMVGFDAADQRGDRGRDGLFGSRGGGGAPSIRAWAEVALFDDRDGTTTWAPVDTWRLRRVSSRMSRNYWEGPLRYVGTHDELDGVIPFAHHLFPPTTVRSYGGSGMPAFWGWFVTPVSPERAYQSLTFDAVKPAVRAGDQRRDR